MSSFTHLHVHSEYTLLAATASIDSLVATAVADGMSHLALTDSNVLYGAVEFSQACKSADLQPLLGMTLTVQPPLPLAPSPPDTLVLLATNPSGYRSLCRLSSLIQASPQRELLAQQGVTWEQLKENRAGLIAIAGGRHSLLTGWLHNGDQKTATSWLSRFGGLFDDHGYLALELHTPTDVKFSDAKFSDAKFAREVAALGQRFGLPSVAVQPVYCLSAQERPRLRLLAAIDRNCKIEEVPLAALPGGDDPTVDLHWLHPNEMRSRFVDFPTALAAIDDITARCASSLPDGRPIFPVLKLPADLSPEQALADLAEAGLQRKMQNADFGIEYNRANIEINQSGLRTPQSAITRLKDELALITHTGYAPLFLVVADVVRFARSQQIPVSTRGSVANSLVAYCVGITTVDPLANNLLFERFLNPERGNPPDIDLDFCSVRRDEVLNYVRHTYGEERVALVATVSTMRPRSAMGETAKAYGMSDEASSKLVKLLPNEWHPDPRRRVSTSLSDMLAKLDTDEQRRIVSAAYEIIGQPHHLSIHPGGMVITPGPLTDVVPLQWTPKGFLITQFAHEHVEAIGLPKLDLLGIRALTVLADAAKLVRQHHDPDFQLETIALDDTLTATMLMTGDTVGVFQCESSGARRTLRQLKAKNIRDLAVANAFFKPGPATGGMAASFIRRYRGEERATYLHSTLEPILGFTQGVLIFQEQILRVARQIAGLSWAEADYLRKGMSKFQADAMTQIRSRFIEGCIKLSGFSSEQANTLWEQVQAFAGYGFNQGHATAYADVSYRSAWLKAHYPAAFLAARLANHGGFHHPSIYIAEAQRLGIAVRPPHVNFSNHGFTLGFAPEEKRGRGREKEKGLQSENTNLSSFNLQSQVTSQSAIRNPQSAILWMGLGQVRNLRHGSIDAIIAERGKRSFADLDDLLARVALQQKEITHLIQCGALDGLDESRAALLDTATGSSAHNRQQLTFDFAAAPIKPESATQRFVWEKEVLDQPLSVQPLQTVTYNQNELITLDQAASRRAQVVRIAGYRLPGWTGGKGFYLSDGQSYAIAVAGEKIANPRPWAPIRVRGRWALDEWGGGWVQVEHWESLG